MLIVKLCRQVVSSLIGFNHFDFDWFVDFLLIYFGLVLQGGGRLLRKFEYISRALAHAYPEINWQDVFGNCGVVGVFNFSFLISS